MYLSQASDTSEVPLPLLPGATGPHLGAHSSCQHSLQEGDRARTQLEKQLVVVTSWWCKCHNLVAHSQGSHPRELEGDDWAQGDLLLPPPKHSLCILPPGTEEYNRQL